MRTEDDPIEQEIDALALEALQGVLKDGVIDRRIRELGIVEQAPQALDFAVLLGGSGMQAAMRP